MTKEELKDRVSVFHGNGYSTYIVQIEYKGNKYSCQSHNSLAFDSLLESDYPKPMTEKQALQSFYDECKRENSLR